MSECVEFQGYKNRGGYGQKSRNGKLYLAHRLAWIDTHGEIPEGIFVCHTCDNRACINLDHLFLGTNADNMRDKKNKGRASRLKGSANSQSKLTEADIPVIRQRLANGEFQYAIACDYGVGQKTISQIFRNRTWTHV